MLMNEFIPSPLFREIRFFERLNIDCETTNSIKEHVQDNNVTHRKAFLD